MTDHNVRIRVEAIDGDIATFASTGLHEDYEYSVNIYTSELIVERVTYGPRGEDAWARRSSTVVAAWPDGAWTSVTQYA
jgi:hypothetical protein